MLDYVYKAHLNGKLSNRFYCRTKDEVWKAIQSAEAYGLEREYKPTIKELKKDGYSVVKYKLVRV